MRPTKHPQSALRAPLNHILGTEANVRVLRVLFRSPIPMGMAELARSTALQASGLPKVCDRLEDLGVIETVGRGHNRQFWRRLRSPLANHLSSLFSAEHDAGEAVLSDIRSAVLGMSGVIRAAWIEGSVAKGTDLPGDPIVVVELVDASSIESTRDELGRTC